MKEILISNGFKRAGGCRCSGGAEFYGLDISPRYRIDWYYKSHFLVLKYNNRQIRKGIESEINDIIQQVKNDIHP